MQTHICETKGIGTAVRQGNTASYNAFSPEYETLVQAGHAVGETCRRTDFVQAEGDR